MSRSMASCASPGGTQVALRSGCGSGGSSYTRPSLWIQLGIALNCFDNSERVRFSRPLTRKVARWTNVAEIGRES